jgi:hypothetical protein
VSRKRQLKKERARAGALEQQLQDLYRRGADEAFLELVHARARDRPEAAPADLYGKVVDRALRQALAGADLGRVERLLKRVRPDARSRPLVRLAEVVQHLVDGRPEKAQAGLAALAPAAPAAGAATPVPPRLLAGLEALCHAADGGSPALRPAWSLYRGLTAFAERGFRATGHEVGSLRRSLGALRSALAADPVARKLAEVMDEYLRLLVALNGVERALRPRKGGGPAAKTVFVERTRRLSRPLLEVFRARPPGLLRPLHQALRRRWRALLQLVAERDGAAVWAEVEAASPALFAFDLDGGEGSATGLGGDATWAAVRRLLAAGRFRGLASLLAARSDTEKVPARLVALWALELWTWKQVAQSEAELEDEFAGEPPEDAALARLAQMAAEVAQGIPAEQRAEVAQFLRVRLLEICQAVFFGELVLDAAAALLRHLEDDPALLATALVAAVCEGDVRAQNLFAARIAARGPARAEERKAVLGVVAQLAAERARHLAAALPRLQTLLGEEGWPEALHLAARGLTGHVESALRGVWSQADFRRLTAEVEVCRTVLAGCVEYAAIEVALGCLRQDSAGRRGLRRFFVENPGLEAALTVLRVLESAVGPWVPPQVGETIREARAATVDRLDLRWRVWRPLLPLLVLGTSRREVKRLRNRLRSLLRSKGLSDTDRAALQGALAEVGRLEQMDHDPLGMEAALRAWFAAMEDAEDAEEPEMDRRKQRRRRREADRSQLDFDFF